MLACIHDDQFEPTMPIIAIVLSGVVSGPFLWLTRGSGLEQIDQLLRERRDRKRRQKALAGC
jgi:hypothetical protein